MNRRTLIFGAGACILGAVIWAELSYFRFHTYFLSTEVQETLPPMPSGRPATERRTVVSGSFVSVDAVHRGSGTALIIEQDGKRYLRLENFEVTNGPDLFVYVSESATPGSTLQSLGRYVSLGRLKGNIGNQTYAIPDSARDLATALIWCEKFGVLFSYAVMR